MTSMEYLNLVLSRYNTTPLLLLPLSPAYQAVAPVIRAWGNPYIRSLDISGSNAKGTGVAGEADLDLFISLHSNVLTDTSHTLASIYNSLAQKMRTAGYVVRRQNVSVRINHRGTEVDIVPAVKYAGNTNDHWLHVTKSRKDRTKTNIAEHIRRVANSGRIGEIRLTKIWRKLNGLDFPSVYLEETIIDALSGYGYGNLNNNFWRVLGFLENGFTTATVFDPANGANTISNELSPSEKIAIKNAATLSRTKRDWKQIVW